MPFYVGDDVLYVIYPIDKQIKILVSLFSYYLFIYFYVLMLARIYLVGDH